MHEPLELMLAPEIESVPEARHLLAAWLKAEGVGEPAASDLVTAANELCTNGVQAARGKVILRAFFERDAVVIEVSDDGPGIEGNPELVGDPDPLAEHGWGLFVAREMVDVLWLHTDEATGGIRARAAKRIA